MKKGTRALANFSHVELGQVFQALEMHRKEFKYTKKLLFDITFIRIAMKKDLEVIKLLEFDGMEMRTMSEALRFRGKNLYKHENYLAALRYFELAQEIEGEMYLFQMANKPEFIPQFL